MKRIILSDRYNGTTTILSVDGESTVVLEKSRKGVNEYEQPTINNTAFLDGCIQNCKLILENKEGTIFEIVEIEHFSKFFVFRVILQSVWFLPLPDEKAIKFLNDILMGKDVKLKMLKMFSSYEDALNNIK